ncbi:phage tail tape measure protein [Curtobacterium sp. 1544]|uniref:phage tail tape measure protein n=1 Tax=Curtobacterium sp. 1544 TaxID=3156417 RepID=UPI003390997F
MPDFSLSKENILADRVVKVTIQASIANYVQGMEKVRKATAAAANESDKLEKVGQSAEKVGGAVLTMGAAATASVLAVTKMAADFDAQMSKVQAATGATASEMDKFRNQALTAGVAFGYTATQVTEAQIELGKAGVATKDILGGGLSGVLALAASDNLDLGKATQIASVAMKQFNLQGKDIPHIADLLAAGAGKALGGVDQLGDALNQSGLVASNFGFSIEETTGVLSAFADAGLLGSDAGTSLKTMLQQLANPSKESSELMKSLGINVEDANGQFLGAANIAQVLHDKLGTLSDAQRQQALAQIFGSDAVRAATVLYKEGADGIQDYIDQNNDAGYAIDQAAKKSNNLNGDLKKLQSAVQSSLIDTGSSASSALRPLVQNVTQFVQAVNQMPEPLKAAALGTTAVVGGASLLAGGLMLAVPKIVQFRSAMAALRESGITGRAALGSVSGFLGGPWVGGVTLGVTAIALLNTELAKLKASSGEVTHVLQAAKNVQEIYDTLGKGMIWSPGTASISDQLKDLDGALQAFASHNSDNGFQAILTRFTNTDYSQGVNALRDINEEMGQLASSDPSKAVHAFKLLADQTDGTQKSLHRLVDAIGGDYRSALVSQADALGITANDTNLVKLAMGQYADAAKGAKQPTQDNADALNALQEAAGEAAPSIDDVSQALKDLTSPTLDARAAQRDLEAAIDAVSASVKDNGTSLDVTTEKGRANEAALDAIAQAAQNNAAALLKQTGSQDQATSAMESGRNSLIAALGQYNITGQAAEDYADKILGTPDSWATLFTNNAGAASASASAYKAQLDALPTAKRTQINAATAAAKTAVQSVIDVVNNLPSSKTITITTNRVTTGTADNTVGIFKAGGGHVRGPGSETSDSIPAMLSDNEYVIKASSVRKYGTGFLDRVNAGRYANGGQVRKYAGGGAVQFEYSRRNGDYSGLSGVSQLMSIANDSSYKARWRNDVGMAALRFQSSLSKLTDQSSAAASKLSDLRSSADSLKSSVASAVGKFDVGDYRSASSLKRGLSKSAANVTEFANLLTTLSKKGISGDLLAEIASLGTAEGLPLARSLAAASASDIKSINASYASIQSTATKAGQTVADANYKSLIAAADKNAKSLEAQIAKQSKAIQTIIGRSFGLKGFASGGYTGAYGTGQVAGVVHGREFVMNAAATARNRAVLEAMNQGGNVRYMDPTPVAAAAMPTATPVRTGDRHYHLTNLDPTAFVQAVERRERSEYA